MQFKTTQLNLIKVMMNRFNSIQVMFRQDVGLKFNQNTSLNNW